MSEDCCLHFEGKSGPSKHFTYITYEKFCLMRSQWLALSSEYKNFQSVAGSSLDIIPHGLSENEFNRFHFHTQVATLNLPTKRNSNEENKYLRRKQMR